MALSANTSLQTRGNAIEYGSATVLTGSTIYKHAMVCASATGYAVAAANDTTTKFLGFAKAYAQATETVEYFYNCEVRVPIESTQAPTIANTNALFYCYDDEEVTLHNTLGPAMGCSHAGGWFETSYVWIHVLKDLTDFVSAS
jgi:hypothetical protein